MLMRCHFNPLIPSMALSKIIEIIIVSFSMGVLVIVLSNWLKSDSQFVRFGFSVALAGSIVMFILALLALFMVL